MGGDRRTQADHHDRVVGQAVGGGGDRRRGRHPDNWIADFGFDVEASAEAELAKAVARVLDAAVLFGTNAPATFPPGGVVGAATASTGTGPLEFHSRRPPIRRTPWNTHSRASRSCFV